MNIFYSKFFWKTFAVLTIVSFLFIFHEIIISFATEGAPPQPELPNFGFPLKIGEHQFIEQGPGCEGVDGFCDSIVSKKFVIHYKNVIWNVLFFEVIAVSLAFALTKYLCNE